jgi:hypothetical protein
VLPDARHGEAGRDQARAREWSPLICSEPGRPCQEQKVRANWRPTAAPESRHPVQPSETSGPLNTRVFLLLITTVLRALAIAARYLRSKAALPRARAHRAILERPTESGESQRSLIVNVFDHICFFMLESWKRRNLEL